MNDVLLQIILIVLLIGFGFLSHALWTYGRNVKLGLNRIDRIEKDHHLPPQPHFKSMRVNDKFTVSYAIWRITQIETEHDRTTNRHQLRITATPVDGEN